MKHYSDYSHNYKVNEHLIILTFAEEETNVSCVPFYYNSTQFATIIVTFV